MTEPALARQPSIPRQAANPKVPVVYACEWTDATSPAELSRLGCPKDHEILAGEPSSAALPANQGVFFLVERERENALHFFDTKRWRHFTYARDRLMGYDDLLAFNTEMYYRPERRLFLGALTHYLGPDVYAFEIAPTDKATPELILEMFTLVQSKLGWPAKLRYHPTSNALEMAERLPPDVPTIRTEDLYHAATYQGMHLGRTVGRIHVTTLTQLASEYIGRSDIVVIDHVPNDLPTVAGLVTGEFQTPLSHVNLLSQDRDVPNMALVGATENKSFVANDGRWVELQVRADGFTVVPSDANAAESFWSDKRPREPQVPELDLSATELVDTNALNVSWVSRVGGKAANYGELLQIRPALPVLSGFAIPCAKYVAFMEENGLMNAVEHLLTDPELMADGRARKDALAALRANILNGTVDPGLLAAIEQRATAGFGAVPTRLRSSSNLEDLETFNGAGLYESHTWEPGNPKRPLDGALKRVWASLWNFGAFEEREWARIDHRQSAMAVLVHPSFPDAIEAANGVAVTANPFDPPPEGQAAYYVNVQPGASSVTNPDPGVLPESFLYYKPPAGQGEMTYLSYSSVAQGQKILSFDEIVTLNQSLEAIHEHFARLHRDQPRFGMDVEFKFVLPSRSLVIKQARLYPFPRP